MFPDLSDDQGANMKKQPEVTAATRRELIDAFWTLYEKKRIEQMHVKEITDIAHYHRGTFYEYFADIYDLLAQEENALINQIIENAPEVQALNVDEMLKRVSDIYMSNGKQLCLLISKGGDPEFIHKFKHALFPAFRQIKALPSSEAISIIFEFGINGLIMAFYAWYTSENRLPVEEFMSIARSLIENGIPKALEELST